MKKATAFAPATIANLNVGFDVLGLALSGIGDIVELEVNQKNTHQIVSIESETKLPYQIEKNSCSVVIEHMRKFLGSDIFVDISIQKGFKAGSGLGSSAASSVAAAVAYDQILGNPFSKQELLNFAVEGERIACGSPIYDNISAAMLGGLVLMHQGNAIQLPLPSNLWILAYFQQIEIKTEDARNVMPQQYSTPIITQQMADIAAFVHALHTNDFALIKSSIHDKIAEPFRKNLIPNFDEMKQIATENDAIAFGISGSGPTVFTLLDSEFKAQMIKSNFDEITKNQTFESLAIIENLKDNQKGAYIIHPS